MSNVIESTAEFTVQTPKYVQYVLQGLHGLAFFACWFNGLSLVLRFLLALLIVCLWIRNLIGAVRSQPNYLRYTSRQCWYISYDGQEYLPITIGPVCIVNNMVVVLRYKLGIADKVKSEWLFITCHSMPFTDFRRLFVRLKLSRIDQDK